MTIPLIYTPQGNMSPQHIDEHRHWYVHRHAPTLMGVGFFSARMFDGEGTRWCNLYEIPDAAILSTPEYKQIKANDSFRDKNISRFENLNVNIYGQKTILDRSGTKLDRAPTMGGPALTFVRFDWNGSAATLQQWLQEALYGTCAGAANVRTVRLLERGHTHPEFKSTYPNLAAVVEWQEKSPPQDAITRAIGDLGSAAGNVSTETFTKRFGLLREGVLD